jgi:DHA1 family bicyclomycin/chloramphenicol resistance-like MFS transporter
VTLGLLAVVTAFAPLTMDLYLPGLPDLGADLGASESMAQLTVAACICGLALGQLLAGAVSDALGRRAPALAGMALWALATAGCAAATSIGLMVGLRLLAGIGAGACVALARAVIGDLDPANLVRHMSRMLLILAVVPVLAPSLGGTLLRATGWRGLFVTLAVVGVIFAAISWWRLPESLPRPARTPLRVRGILAGYRELVGGPSFVAQTAASGAAFGVMFAYISSSPFVFRESYGLTPVGYGFLFGLNAAGLVLGMQLSPVLVDRCGTRWTQLVAAVTGIAAASALLAYTWFATPALGWIIAPVVVVITAAGVLIPLTSATAIGSGSGRVGAASGLVGFLQFAVGGSVAALVALAGTAHGAAPLALAMTACMLAVLLLTFAGRQGARALDRAAAPAVST